MPRSRRIGLQHGRGMTPRRQAATPGVQQGGGGKSQGPAHGQGVGIGLYLLTTGAGPAVTHRASPGPVATVADLGGKTGSGATAQTNVALASGDMILVTYVCAGTVTATVSDSGGNDYATTSGTGAITSLGWSTGWALASIAAPSTFVKVVFSLGHSYNMRVFRLGGLPAAGAFDQGASASGVSATPNSGPTGALAQVSELAFEIVACDQNGGSWTPDFAHDLGYVDPSTILGIGAAWKQTTTAAAVTAAPTLHPGAGGASWWCQVLTFRLV